jgi:hypothetical protein
MAQTAEIPVARAGVARALGAVVAAMVLVVALMIATNQLLVAELHVLVLGTLEFSLVTLALAALWHALGGFVCAAMTRDSRFAAVALVIVGFFMMAGSVVNTWPTVPPWYSLAMLVLAPACLWFGGVLHQRMRAISARAAA